VRDEFGRVFTQVSYQSAFLNVTDPAPAISGNETAGLNFTGKSSVYFGSLASMENIQELTIEIMFKTSVQASAFEYLYRWRLYGIVFGLRGGILDGVNLISVNKYNDGEWHYAALSTSPVYGDILFVDDEVLTNPTHTTITWGSGGAALGRDGNSQDSYWTGEIADFRYWNKYWNADELAELRYRRANGILAWNHPNLVVALPLPTVVGDHTPVDISGNNVVAPFTQVDS
jgi:hypothetical protein